MIDRLKSIWRRPLLAVLASIALFAAIAPQAPVQSSANDRAATVAEAVVANLQSFAYHALAPSQTAEAAALSNYMQNKFIDNFFRGQTFTAPTTIYIALATSSSSASACGTEVSSGSYARVGVTGSLSNWAGTQSAGSTTASSGTSGQTSNNGAVTFPSPTANWGTVTGFCAFDASSGGNLLFFAALTVSKTVNNGDAAPSFAAAALTYTITHSMPGWMLPAPTFVSNEVPAAFRRLPVANDYVWKRAA